MGARKESTKNSRRGSSSRRSSAPASAKRRSSSKKHRKDFGISLVEIAIAIVVVSLLLAMVAAGRSAINTAVALKVIAEADVYKVAISNFRKQYYCWAGDCVNAVDYFPNDAIASLPGNGDGRVEGREEYVMWRQLGPHGSKLIKDDLTGDGAEMLMAVNRPASQITNKAWMWENLVDPNWPWNPSARLLRTLQLRGTANLNERSISGRIAEIADNKIDDGEMTTGLAVGTFHVPATDGTMEPRVNVEYEPKEDGTMDYSTGEVVFMLERQHIESNPAEVLADAMKRAFDVHCK